MLLSCGQNGKSICVTTTFENFEQRNHPSIEIFINKFLLVVFKRLPNGKETSVCACISKQWLTLLSSVHKDEITKSNGYLARSLVGRKVTIVKLVDIAVGTSNRGGLTKLSIRGNKLYRGVTYIGLKDISRGSPTLREHSLWKVSSVGDKGLSEIAHECHLLEKLDLFQCPRNRGPYGSTGLEHRSLDSVNECRMMNSSTTHPCDPNFVPSSKSERYIALVEFMRSKDLVMIMLINDVELLILASTVLCSDSQRPIQIFSLLECHCGAQMATRSLRQKEQQPHKKKL